MNSITCRLIVHSLEAKIYPACDIIQKFIYEVESEKIVYQYLLANIFKCKINEKKEIQMSGNCNDLKFIEFWKKSSSVDVAIQKIGKFELEIQSYRLKNQYPISAQIEYFGMVKRYE